MAVHTPERAPCALESFCWEPIYTRVGFLLMIESMLTNPQIENLKEKFLKLYFPWISTIPLSKG